MGTSQIACLGFKKTRQSSNADGGKHKVREKAHSGPTSTFPGVARRLAASGGGRTHLGGPCGTPRCRRGLPRRCRAWCAPRRATRRYHLTMYFVLHAMYYVLYTRNNVTCAMQRVNHTLPSYTVLHCVMLYHTAPKLQDNTSGRGPSAQEAAPLSSGRSGARIGRASPAASAGPAGGGGDAPWEGRRLLLWTPTEDRLLF